MAEILWWRLHTKEDLDLICSDLPLAEIWAKLSEHGRDIVRRAAANAARQLRQHQDRLIAWMKANPPEKRAAKRARKNKPKRSIFDDDE